MSHDEEKKLETVVPSIRKEVDLFTRHLESLNETLPLTMAVLFDAEKEKYQHYEKFVSKNLSALESGEKKYMTIPIKVFREWETSLSLLQKTRMACELMPRSLLVAMVSQYDAYLGRLLRALFLLKPESLRSCEKNFSFQEISQFTNIDEFKDFVIEKESETVLRKSHAEQFEYMEKKFGLSLTKGLSIWPFFIELMERRNLFVHNDGIVSSHYLAVCDQHQYKFQERPKEGDKLKVSKKYFRQAYICLYEVGFKLAHVLWRKLLPEQRHEADSTYINSSVALIKHGEYELAGLLLDFACSSFKKYSSERERMMFIVNLAQSHKWLGREEECKNIINAHDWSAMSDDFKLVRFVLLDDWEESLRFMHKIGNEGSVSKGAYSEWPLFKEFIKRQDFLDTYKEIFEEDFIVNIEKNDIENEEMIQSAYDPEILNI